MTTTLPAPTGHTETLSSRVATRVRMLMAARRKSNKELAQVLHLSDRAAIRRRHGEQEFTLSELEKVAAWLDVDPISLLTGRGFEELTA